ncbi:DUF4328 domain-containing protein [Nocardia cyriacigeorgica]|uniref:DUF4328 domain-containing protein n=1 Tax=Nocardia cyriacigeorgica TaxID=135487 RepID=UPI002458C0AF|nr:DUF4328 domain-containing protein [Nocardia cyriacigeorgica]
MSTVVQPCARCGARWAVQQAAPMHWCPRCRGVLLSPGPIDAPAERRNYRWVARRPDHRPRGSVAPGRTGPTPTPHYTEVPRWGLRDEPAREPVAARPPLSVLAGWLPALLIATALMFAIAAGSELGRYLLLLRNRTYLIDPLLLKFSDAMVNASALFAAVLALLAAVAAVGWLIQARRAVYEGRGLRDPRSPRMLVLGCVIPVVNLLWPGVFLSEMVAGRDDPRPRGAGGGLGGLWGVGGGFAGGPAGRGGARPRLATGLGRRCAVHRVHRRRRRRGGGGDAVGSADGGGPRSARARSYRASLGGGRGPGGACHRTGAAGIGYRRSPGRRGNRPGRRRRGALGREPGGGRS